MIPGFKVGHYTDLENATGCTVVLCPPEGAVGGVDVRGLAPASRETDLLRPGHLVEHVHAVLLTGGSAFGLDAASGVMRFLEEKGIGLDTAVARVPIVPAAAIFDLAVMYRAPGSGTRPNAEWGYRACVAASADNVPEGNVGAGTGASVGHLLGLEWATKSGLGVSVQEIANGIIVGAVVVVNAYGDVVDPDTGEILAGTRKPGGGWLDSADALKHGSALDSFAHTNTTIGVVATNAALTKEQANMVAMMAHDGIARAIRPAHTLFDGDALFVLSAGTEAGDVTVVGHTASEVVAAAIVRAVNAATMICGVKARRD